MYPLCTREDQHRSHPPCLERLGAAEPLDDDTHWRGWLEWYPATAITWLWGTLSPRRRVSGYGIQILRIRHQQWFQEDFDVLLELLRAGKIHPVVAERLSFSEARHAHELLESSAAKGKLVLVP